MTELLIFCGLICAVYIDTQSLKRQDSDLYNRTLQFDPRRWTVMVLLLSVAITPVYLLRRRKFAQAFKAGHERNADLSLKSDAAGIIITWFFIISLATLLFEFTSLFFEVFDSRLGELVVSALLYSGLMVFLIFQVTRVYPQGFWASVGFRKGKQSWFKALFVPFVVGIALAIFVAFLMMARQETPVTPLSDALDKTRSPSAFISFFGVALLIAPLLEELIFRGYFFAVISRFKNQTFAVISIAGIFTLLHVGQYWGDWLAIVIVMMLGFTLTVLRAYSGTTIASAIAHYTYNILITFIPVFMLFVASPSYFTYQVFYNELNNSMKEKLLVKTIEKNPDLMDAYNDLAWLYANENKNLDEALTLINEAISFDESNPAYLDTKAEIFFRTGQIKEAISLEKEALGKDRANPMFQKQLKRFKEGLAKEMSL